MRDRSSRWPYGRTLREYISDVQGNTRAYMVALAVFAVALAKAQPATPKPAPTAPVETPKAKPQQQPAEALDQSESLLYMGKKLWFETRKRLNLASEEEVKEQAEEEKKVRLRVGSFKIEK